MAKAIGLESHDSGLVNAMRSACSSFRRTSVLASTGPAHCHISLQLKPSVSNEKFVLELLVTEQVTCSIISQTI